MKKIGLGTLWIANTCYSYKQREIQVLKNFCMEELDNRGILVQEV